MKSDSVCYCAAYSFMHRGGGGKCPGHQESLCEACGLPCDGKDVDFGIGRYECWGSIGTDVRIEHVSACCWSNITDNNEQSRSAWKKARLAMKEACNAGA